MDYTLITNTQKDVIWVAELSRCLRQSFLIRKNEVKFDPRHLILSNIGKGVHKQIQKILKDKGFEIEKKVEYKYDGITITGKIDVFDPSENTVYEIKYTDSTKGKLPEEKLKKYLTQLHYYMDILHMNGIKNVKGFLIIIFPNGKVLELERKYSSTDLLKKATLFKIYLDDNILPDIRKTKPDTECRECPFYNFCWNTNLKRSSSLSIPRQRQVEVLRKGT